MDKIKTFMITKLVLYFKSEGLLGMRYILNRVN